MATRESAENGYEVMSFFAQNSLDRATRAKFTLRQSGRTRVLNPQRVGQPFRTLIVDVCEKYVPFMANDGGLFELAQKDLQFLDEKDSIGLKGEGLARFYFVWAEFTTCWKMTNDEAELQRLVGLLVQTAAAKASKVGRV